MNRLTVEEFKEAEKLPLIVVLDDVRSLYNVGSVFRSCDAFRVEAVYLCGITATPPNAEIHKTALGGEDSVDWEYFKTTEEAVEKLKQKGFFIYSIEQVEGSTKLQNLPEAHSNIVRTASESEKRENSSLFTLHSSLQKMIHSPSQCPDESFHFQCEEEGGESSDVYARLHGNHVDLQVVVS